MSTTYKVHAVVSTQTLASAPPTANVTCAELTSMQTALDGQSISGADWAAAGVSLYTLVGTSAKGMTVQLNHSKQTTPGVWATPDPTIYYAHPMITVGGVATSIYCQPDSTNLKKVSTISIFIKSSGA